MQYDRGTQSTACDLFSACSVLNDRVCPAVCIPNNCWLRSITVAGHVATGPRLRLFLSVAPHASSMRIALCEARVFETLYIPSLPFFTLTCFSVSVCRSRLLLIVTYQKSAFETLAARASVLSVIAAIPSSHPVAFLPIDHVVQHLDMMVNGTGKHTHTHQKKNKPVCFSVTSTSRDGRGDFFHES